LVGDNPPYGAVGRKITAPDMRWGNGQCVKSYDTSSYEHELLTFLRGLERRRQALIMLLHIIVIEQFPKWNLRFLWITDTPNIFDKLLYFIV
jgi:hypothetical protein